MTLQELLARCEKAIGATGTISGDVPPEYEDFIEVAQPGVVAALVRVAMVAQEWSYFEGAGTREDENATKALHEAVISLNAALGITDKYGDVGNWDTSFDVKS
jgi:hypothetical protein